MCLSKLSYCARAICCVRLLRKYVANLCYGGCVEFCLICLHFNGLNLESAVLVNLCGRFDAWGVIKVGMTCLFIFVSLHLCVCVCLVTSYPLRIQESKLINF